MAQLVEQLIRNEQAVGSSPTISSNGKPRKLDVYGVFLCQCVSLTSWGVQEMGGEGFCRNISGFTTCLTFVKHLLIRCEN